MDIFAVAVWHVFTIRKSDILHLTRKESLQLGFAGKAKAKLKHSSSCLYVMEWSWTWDSPNKRSQLRVGGYFLPNAAILPDVQGSTPSSSYLKRKGLDNKKQNPFNMRACPDSQGLHLTGWVLCSARVSCQGFYPSSHSAPYGLAAPEGNVLCIPASPQPSPQCGMCRQRHRQTALHTGSCSSCCSSFTHLLLDKPTGWRAELLIPVIHFFWHKHPSQLNHRWEDTSYMHAKEWEGKRKEADFMVLFVYTGIIL